METQTKMCTQCKEIKPLSEFYARYTTKGNVGMSRCRNCFKKKQHERYVEKKREDVRVRTQARMACEQRQKRA